MLCTDSLMKGDKLCQIPYYNGRGSFICRACFNICRGADSKTFKQTDHYFFPYQCQCQHLPGAGGQSSGCMFTERIKEATPAKGSQEEQEEIKLKLSMIEGLEKEIEKLTTVEVKPNML